MSAAARPRRRRLALGAVALVVLAAVAGGLTYALWSTDAVASVGVIRAGNLDLELVDGVQWAETSPDVQPAHAVPLQADGRTAAHLATPGDSFTVTQRFRTTLEGDNLRARLTVDWQTPPSLRGGVAGTYRVTAPDGSTSTATALGTPVTLPGGTANLAAGSGTWTLTVALTWSGTSDVVVAPGALAAAPTTAADLGTLRLDLHQVRDGDGFAP